MPPSSPPTYVFCTQSDVENLLSVDGLTGRLDDDESGSSSAGETAYLTQAIRWATARVHMHCVAYPQPDLAQSWVVNQWTAIIAAYLVSCRRGNPSASSLKEMYDEAMQDLKLVKSGEYALPDAAVRDSAFPAWSNVRVDPRYQSKKIRVETSISGRKGDRGGQTIDRADQIIGPIESV